MGNELTKFFACYGKQPSPASSSSPQHLLSSSPSSSSSSQPSQKKDFGPRKLDGSFSALYAKRTPVALIELASPFLNPSRVCGEGLTSDRSSSSVFFTGPLRHHPAAINVQARLQSLVSSIAATLGRNELRLTEALQVVKYSEGESYALHRDNDTEKDNGILQRAATAIIYLNSTLSKNAGGQTHFPNASSFLKKTKNLETNGVKYLKSSSSEASYYSGFSVQPRQGHVLLFWSALPNGKEDLAALHEAAPVLRGEKFIATHWFSEQPPIN
ncbi:putative prolyl 4-hydroxylase 9 [Nannochloris sp. 'desiccata']|nr:hypothetical protein KSW81_007225 [Chlorella desiccata (nom. nud.)]KAH7621656.1 putative prolyl 4-hydroxylase 9 [Chlorella desiccata (nom. nud.)]